MDKQAIEHDGTWDATIAAPLLPLTGASLFTVRLPAGLAQGIMSGRYFLARCGAQTLEEREQHWQIYLRRPLFVATQRQGKREDQAEDKDETWELLLPASPDPGYRWLAKQSVGATVNLLGPLGQGFSLAPHTRHLLLLATAARAATLLALIDPILDKGGHVTLVLYTDKASDNPLLPLLPIPVEVRLATNEQQWQKHLTETMQWADQLCAAVPAAMFPQLRDLIKRKRFRLEAGFAQVLVEADLVCDVGACLACVIPLASGGYTRACVHGPVFDLVHLV
ncbi:MAG: hypothetical protein U0350_41630 [Caldilineaceae bacterium]